MNTADRTDVLAFYNTIYRASENYASKINWSGNLSTGNVGTTSADFKADVLRRINFFRALSGVSADIVFDSTLNAKCQEAAAMFSANFALSHDPPKEWALYSPNAAEAANNSNIALGSYGPGAIDNYMSEEGANNYPVGHRRWLLYPQAQTMGTGDVPESQNYFYPANATWVLAPFKTPPPPAFIAWPNAGFVPKNLVPARWSLSFPNANFSTAKVTMTRNGTSVATTIVSKTDDGYGDNTIVWEPTASTGSGTNDVSFTVSVSNIQGSGVPSSFSYTVKAFHPDVLGDTITISGPSTPTTAGTKYTFNAINQADAYKLLVSKSDSLPWSEGAENATYIIDQTSIGYNLRQTDVKRTGSYGFHLCFSDHYELTQGFEINRDIIPTATSSLVFYDHMRFFWESGRLSAEISADGGNTWSEIWGRNGRYAPSSANWDPSFNLRNISLAAYAGLPIRIRFMIRSLDGYFYNGTNSNYGIFLDDITVTNAILLVDTTTTILPSTATSFYLDALTAGAPLVAGNIYYLRIFPNVGTRYFANTTFFLAQTIPPTPFDVWKSSHFTTSQIASGMAEPNADPDEDGLINLVEYALGSSPLNRNATAPISSVYYGGTFSLTFTCFSDRQDITYTVQATDTLDGAWTDIARSIGGGPMTPIASRSTVYDSGIGNRSVVVYDAAPPSPTKRRFFRLSISTN